MASSTNVTGHTIRRPDAAELYWEARGEGPLVLLAHGALWSHPAIYADFIADLAQDHRVVTYDPRGCGRSSQQGPYEPERDAEDLSAVAEAAGGGAVTVAVADGFNRAIRVAATQPDLIHAVIALGPAPAAFLPQAELKGSEAMAGSESVIEMILKMMTTDPRAALRMLIGSLNPDLQGDDLRKRVDLVADYIHFDAGQERARRWLEDDVSGEMRRVGDRLWILHGGSDPMFEGALGARVRSLFPEAHLVEVADGPISRPELTAARVRDLTRAPKVR